MQPVANHKTGHDGSGKTDTGSIVLEAVAEAVGRLNFGTVLLTVHEGRVVQLEVTERQRFSR